MSKQEIATYSIDVTGTNGTPFRFVLWPATDGLRCYSRRHTLAPGQPGYGFNNACEDGQACGPAFAASTFGSFEGALRGWHGVDAWDVDDETMSLVGAWIQHTMAAHARLETHPAGPRPRS